MLPTVEELKAKLESSLGIALAVEGPALLVEAKDLIWLCRHLKSSVDLQLDYVANLTAVDYLPDAATGGTGRMDVVYHLYSMAKKHGPVTLKVKVPRTTPAVPSLVPVYRGAELQEREAYDLYGVHFDGHPDLRRILMWDGFEGHPMRKDYVPEDQNQPEEQRT